MGRASALLMGKPLDTAKMHDEQVGMFTGASEVITDVLSSLMYAFGFEATYLYSVGGPQAIDSFALGISVVIAIMLGILTASYMQIIKRYSTGGGAYTVAGENIHPNAGLIAGIGLLLDYLVLTPLSVSAAGTLIVGATGLPQELRVPIAILILVVLMLLNLRGISTSGKILRIPVALFILTVLAMATIGYYKVATGQIVPVEVDAHHVIPAGTNPIGIMELLGAFTAAAAIATGTEALSNSVPIFRAPSSRNANRALLMTSVIVIYVFLSMVLVGIKAQVKPTLHDVIPITNQVIGAIWGLNTPGFYWTVSIGSLILVLAANTGFIDFPRVTALMSRDKYLPNQMRDLAPRLIFHNGIFVLTGCAAAMVAYFNADEHRMLGLYAVGVFMSFTLSQAGMTRLQYLEKKYAGMVMNLVGALTTGLITVFFTYTKWEQGAWLVVILVPAIFLLMKRVKRHYNKVRVALSLNGECPAYDWKPRRMIELNPEGEDEVHVLLMEMFNKTTERMLNGMKNKKFLFLHVSIDPEATERLVRRWEEFCNLNGWDKNLLVILNSPYRELAYPVNQYLPSLKAKGWTSIVIHMGKIQSSFFGQWMHHNSDNFLLKALPLNEGTFKLQLHPIHINLESK